MHDHADDRIRPYDDEELGPRSMSDTTLTSGTGPVSERRRYEPRIRRASNTRVRSYSIVVTLFRYLLPTVAIIVIALVVLWPQLQAPVEVIVPPPEVTAERAEVAAPQFFSVDEQGQPFSVIATSATQEGLDDAILLLEAPEAEITLNNGTWLALIAESGRYDRVGGALAVWDEVNLLRDDGVQVFTDEAHFDLNIGQGWGDLPVVVSGAFGVISGQGFRLDQERGDVVVVGKARLLLRRSSGAEEDE